MRTKHLIAAAALAAASAPAFAADINVSIGGEISPGVYGRVDIGTGRPPPLVYAEPVIIAAPPPALVVRQPIYLNVPPGHAKDWRKHCKHYNACGQPVYFVRTAEYDPGYQGNPGHADKGKGHGKGKGH
jgi:hypothetical protein